MQALINRCQDTEVPEAAVMIDGDPGSYAGVKWPVNWEIHVAERHLEFGGALNALFMLHPGRTWYGWMIDRARPQTKNWASKLIEAAIGGFANVKPLEHGDRLNPRLGVERVRTGVFDARILRAVGWIYPPWVIHFFGDDVWEDVLHAAGMFRSTDIIVGEEHMPKHPRIFNDRPYWQADADSYSAWLKSGQRENMIEQVRAAVA